MFTQSDANVILSIHEGLFRLDNEGNIVPAVAESITNVDPLNWIVKIRQGLTFHNGEPINADAVVFTFDRAKKLFAAGKGDLTFALGALKYDRVEKVDDYSVRFVMKEPDPIITSHLVNPEVSILPPKYYSENSPEKVVFAPVGAGGYKFVSYKAGEGLVLTAFDKYRLGKPPVDDVVVKSVPEVATRISELKAGSADLITGVPADLKQNLESTRGVKVVVAPSYRRLFIAIKQGRHPALADLRVRQAMNYAVNCDEIASSLIGGMAKCQIDLINAPYNNPDLKPFPYDPAKAKQLLDEAGWVPGKDGIRAKNGVRLALDFDTTNGSYLMDKEIAQVMVDYWKDVGIEIKDLRVIDNSINAQMRAKQGAGYRDLMNSSSGPDYTCQGDLLLVQKDSGSNRMSWSDREVRIHVQGFRPGVRPVAMAEEVLRGGSLCCAASTRDLVVHGAEPVRRVRAPRVHAAPRRPGLSQPGPQGDQVVRQNTFRRLPLQASAHDESCPVRVRRFDRQVPLPRSGSGRPTGAAKAH